MEGIRQWAFSACVAVVASGIARMILPKSNLQKVFSVTSTVFFLCCLLSPVVLRPGSFSIPVGEYSAGDIERRAEALVNTVSEQAGESVSASVEKIIVGMLDEMGIKPVGVTINMLPNGQNDPRVESADLILGQAYLQEHGSIRGKLEDALGFPVRLSYQAGK